MQCILDHTNNETIVIFESKNKPYINLTLAALCTYMAISTLLFFISFHKFLLFQQTIVNIMIIIHISVLILFYNFVQIPCCDFIIVSFCFMIMLNAILKYHSWAKYFKGFIKMLTTFWKWMGHGWLKARRWLQQINENRNINLQTI